MLVGLCSQGSASADTADTFNAWATAKSKMEDRPMGEVGACLPSAGCGANTAPWNGTGAQRWVHPVDAGGAGGV